MEDYKKKYEEVLDKLKSLIKNDTDHIIYEDDILERVPELRESDDEKIRKFIIEIFKDSQRNGVSQVIMPEQFDKIFAWLEKQGEPKLLNNEEYQTVPVETLDRLYAAEKELEKLKQYEQERFFSMTEEEHLAAGHYKDSTGSWIDTKD